MSSRHVLWNPPSLHTTIWKGIGRLDDHAAFQSAFHDIGKKVDPPFRCNVGFPLLDHGRDRRHGVANGDRGIAVVPFIENELVEIRHNLGALRSEEHTSELQSLMRISYAVFCLKKKIK